MASNQDEPKPEENDAPEATTPEGASEEKTDVEAPSEDAAAATAEGADEDPTAEADAEATEEAAAEAAEAAGDDAPSEASTAADAATSTAKKSGGKSKSQGDQSAGQRLAAAKAAKAAKKAAARGKEAQELEEQAIERANQAGEWLKEHKRNIGVVLVGALVLAVVVTGWGMYASGRANDASNLLWEAVATSRAPLVPAGLSDDDAESFETLDARAEATVPGARDVAGRYPNTVAAVWAHLIEGASLLETGEFEAARAAYEAALASEKGSDDTRARALEGLAFAYEGEERLDDAISQLEALKNLADGAFAPTASYHIARLKLARGDEAAALEGLRDVVAAFAEEGAPRLPYIRSEAEARLVVLDPSFAGAAQPLPVGAPAGQGAGYPTLDVPEGGMTQEQLEALIQQLQAQQEAAGGE